MIHMTEGIRKKEKRTSTRDSYMNEKKSICKKKKKPKNKKPNKCLLPAKAGLKKCAKPLIVVVPK
jgi:hypothetical protein